MNMFRILTVSILIVSFGLTAKAEKANHLENISHSIIDFEGKDTRGRIVNTDSLRGKILIIGFSTQDTSDDMIEWQTEVGYVTGITMGGYEDIFVMTVADVSKFPWIARPFVKKELNKIYQKANERLLKRFEENKVLPPDDIVDRIYLVPDWSGDIIRSFGLEDKMDKPHIALIDENGLILSLYSENTEESRQKVYKEVEKVLNKNQ